MWDISDDYPDLHEECEKFACKMAEILTYSGRPDEECFMDYRILQYRMEHWFIEKQLKIKREQCQKQ